MPFLFESYNGLERVQGNHADLPQSILSNIRHPLRPYQKKGLQRFIHYHTQYLNRENNNHLLFEMATGTGKTLMMVSLMLYLYEQGYRNFIFFVNSTNILEKTKQNFISVASSKYLFQPTVEIDSHRVNIQAIESLDEANPNALNILFTTIQGLHNQINNPKENSFTLADFEEHKVVLLADEAHHLNTQTKSDIIKLDNWEDTVLNIYQQNPDNHLIEFTATAQLDNSAIKEKYQDKVIMQYALKEFRQDKYSKNIFLAKLDSDNLNNKFLFSIILNQYRQEVAAKYNLNLKPVMLFKSKTIKDSIDNHQQFNDLINRLAEQHIDSILKLIDNHKHIPIYDSLYNFFKSGDFSSDFILQRLKISFSEDKTVNANKDADIQNLQIKLNTLEEANNRLRAIFAVDKLNEGWDVLNLYDIVKLYETPTTKGKPPTAKEIQLIGRGARLYPFILSDDEITCQQDPYKRKFDYHLNHEAIVLEQLHFHTTDGSQFIDSLNQELAKEGLIDDQYQEIEFNLKSKFKQSPTYQQGVVYINKKLKRTSNNWYDIKGTQQSLFGELQSSLPTAITGKYRASMSIENTELANNQAPTTAEFTNYLEYQLKQIPNRIFYKALAKNKNFQFEQLTYYLKIDSVQELKQEFGDYKLIIHYPKNERQENIETPDNLLAVCQDFLNSLYQKFKAFQTEYYGSKFEGKRIKDIIKNKKITVHKNANQLLGENYPHYAQETFKGDSQYEESILQEIDNYFRHHKGYEPVWLIRNQKYFTIYDKQGRGYEPDFLLMVTKPQGYQNQDGTTNPKIIYYQLFIEPKGEHLQAFDQWKLDLTKNLADTEQQKNMLEKYEQFKLTNVTILALPFYSTAQKNDFLKSLTQQLNS